MLNLEIFDRIVTKYGGFSEKVNKYEIRINFDEILWYIDNNNIRDYRSIGLSSDEERLTYSRTKGMPNSQVVTYVETQIDPAIIRVKLNFVEKLLEDWEKC